MILDCCWSLRSKAISFVFLALVFYPLAMYRVPVLPGVNISLDRLSLALAIFFWLVTFLLAERLIRFCSSFQVVFFATLLSGIVGSISPTTNVPAVAIWEKLPIFTMNMSLIFLIFELCRNNEKNIKLILFSFFIVGIIYVFFSSYSVWHFFYRGLPPTDIPFREYVPFNIPVSEHLSRAERFTLGNYARLTLPFTRPQDLGLASCISAFFIFGTAPFVKVTMKRFVYLLTFILVFVVLISGSRSAIYPGLIGIITFRLLSKRSHKVSIRNVVKLFFIILLLGVIFFLLQKYLFDVGKLMSDTFYRLLSAERSTEHHLYIREKTFEVFTELPFFQILIGCGFGSFPYLFEGVTSGHMTYGTILIETGLIGLLSLIALFIFIGVNILKVDLKRVRPEYIPLLKSSISICIVIAFANLLYQFYYSTYQWAAIGLIAAIFKSKNVYYKS